MIDAIRERMNKGKFRGLAKYNARIGHEDVERVADLVFNIKVHRSIQRLGGNSGESGWDKKNCNEYLKAFFAAETNNAVIVVDCRAALRFNQRIGDKKSIDFFEKEIKEFETRYLAEHGPDCAPEDNPVYLSIDGNHTTSVLSNFYLNKVAFEDTHNGELKATWFNDLPEKMQKDISSKYQVPFIILEDITVDQASTLFQQLNKQTSLNPQEHRQARITPLADFVRDTANEEKSLNMFSNIFKQKKRDMREHEQMFARFVCHLLYPGEKRDKKLLDKLYEENYQLPPKTEKKVEEIFDTMANAWDAAFEKTTIVNSVKQSDISTLWLVLAGLDIVGLKINKSQYKNFVQRYLEVILKLDKESNELPAACNGWNFNYLKGNSAIDAEAADKLVDIILLRFNELGFLDCGSENSIVSRCRNSSDSFSFKAKAQRLAEQDFEVGGKKINILDFYQPKNNLLHADHIVPFSKGGETTPDNLDLLSPLENQAKGDRMPEQPSV